jgi:hypothetical protein
MVEISHIVIGVQLQRRKAMMNYAQVPWGHKEMSSI